jgi:poly(hydroxyalkanoate) depolymerase family esterase
MGGARTDIRRKLLAMVAGGVALAVVVGVIVALTSESSPSPGGPYQRGVMSAHGAMYPYAVYVPSSRRAGSVLPLVVVLHGCTMTADEMAAASQYDALAERDRFIVLYPDVDATDAANGRCWKGIWEPLAEGRGRGDAVAIAQMTQDVVARWHIDRNRVYAIGISAGGFETAILAADYPDLYAAIGIHSGTAYLGGEPACAPADGLTTGSDAAGRAALVAMGPRARVVPVVVLHGDADDRVPYRCGQLAVAQWLRTDRLVLGRGRRAPVPSAPTGIRQGAAPGGHAYTLLSYADRSGCVIAELWTVHGMGHFWSGGSSDPSSARFSDPRGPSAAAASWAFFSRWGLTGPLQPCGRSGYPRR